MMSQKERGLLEHFRPNTGSWPELALCHHAFHTKFNETIFWTAMGYSTIEYLRRTTVLQKTTVLYCTVLQKRISLKKMYRSLKY
jgi:hypothetical protein